MAPPATDAAATTTKQEEQHAEAGAEGVESGGGDLRLVADCGDLRLVADCGTEVALSRSAARMSAMFLEMMEAGCVEGPIPIKGADVGTLRLVAAYCEKHAPHYDPVASAARLRDPFPPFPIDFEPATYAVRPVTHADPDPHGLEAWDRKLISDLPDNSALFNLIIVANLMAVEDLVDLGCTAVADKMRGKTPEEIRVALDIENDYTKEEEAQVRRENAWAFED